MEFVKLHAGVNGISPFHFYLFYFFAGVDRAFLTLSNLMKLSAEVGGLVDLCEWRGLVKLYTLGSV